MGVINYSVGDYVLVEFEGDLVEGIIYMNDGSIVYLADNGLNSSYITQSIVNSFECLTPFLGKSYNCVMADDDRVEPYNTCIGGE